MCPAPPHRPAPLGPSSRWCCWRSSRAGRRSAACSRRTTRCTRTSPSCCSGPSSRHLLGTDYLGRDVLSRLMAGTRLSVLSALEAVVVALVIGATTGLASVFLGRVFDYVGQPGQRRPDDAADGGLRRRRHRGARQPAGPGDVRRRRAAGADVLPGHPGGDSAVRAGTVRRAGASCSAPPDCTSLRVHVLRKVLPTVAVTAASAAAAALLYGLVADLPRHRSRAPGADLGWRALQRPGLPQPRTVGAARAGRDDHDHRRGAQHPRRRHPRRGPQCRPTHVAPLTTVTDVNAEYRPCP